MLTDKLLARTVYGFDSSRLDTGAIEMLLSVVVIQVFAVCDRIYGTYCGPGGPFLVVALAREAKEKIVGDFRSHDSDTGSAPVQIALLSQRISELQEHFKTHKKDNHSRRGLLMMVQQRRSLLNYLKRSDIQRYHEVVGRLGLRR